MISCPNCGHDSPAESNFCGNCGTKLPRDTAEPQTNGKNAAATPPPEAPKELAGGRYTVARYLGEGGRKRVYLAHDTLLDRDVAIGIVKTSGPDPAVPAELFPEAQSMPRPGGHPHVRPVHDIGQGAGGPY